MCKSTPVYAGMIIRFTENIGAETSYLFEATARYGSTKEVADTFHQKAEQELSMESKQNENSRIII